MKKIISLGLLLAGCLLTACSSLPRQTYTYSTEDDLSVSVLKTSVYEDKLVVKFSEDAFSNVESIQCYDENFEEILKEVEFKGEDDVLTIYTEDADSISGLKVIVNELLYYSIRYLDSDSYAMLRGDWADDYGYFVSGDEEAYYSEAEKERQKRLQQERQEERDSAFAMVEGAWECEDGRTRIVVSDVESPTIAVYSYREGGWDLTDQTIGFSISLDKRQEPLCVSIEEARGYSVLYEFYMSEDLMSFECSFLEGEFAKVEN